MPQTPPPMIDVRSLSFGYRDTLLLKHVSFTLNRGDFAVIVGSNGTGKTTMLKLLLGWLEPTDGSIQLMGQAVPQKGHLPGVGYLPQRIDVASFPATSEEIVLTGLYPLIGFLRLPTRRHKRMAREALALVGMDDFSHVLFGELSGGQQQRVLLARVLAHQPQLLVLDEPLAGIDEATVSALALLLGRLNKENNMTILMVTHDLRAILQHANRYLCLSDTNFTEDNIPKDRIFHAHETTKDTSSGEPCACEMIGETNKEVPHA